MVFQCLMINLESVPYYRPAEDSPELDYMRRRRKSLGGSLPARQADFTAMKAPGLDTFKKQLESSGDERNLYHYGVCPCAFYAG